MRRQQYRTDGFTLVELMIVVALIGVLATLGFSQFTTWQAKTRRSEAFVNLQAVAAHEKGYHAERDEFYQTGNSFPNYTTYGGLGGQKMEWDAASQVAFGPLGFEPEGNVFHSYEVNTTQSCDPGCDTCFTASAFGDVDTDGFPSAVMYVQPQEQADGSLAACRSNLFNFGTPTNIATGASVFSQVAVNRETDEY